MLFNLLTSFPCASVVPGISLIVSKAYTPLASVGSSRKALNLTYDFLSLAGQLLSDLYPRLVQSLLDSSNVGIGLRIVRPNPAIVVHIGDHIETPRCDLIQDIRYSLQPNRIQCPVWRLCLVVVCISHRKSNTLKACILDIVECRGHYWWVVP